MDISTLLQLIAILGRFVIIPAFAYCVFLPMIRELKTKDKYSGVRRALFVLGFIFLFGITSILYYNICILMGPCVSDASSRGAWGLVGLTVQAVAALGWILIYQRKV